MTAFDKAWGVAKYDDDPECGDCETPIPNGNQYGCERCGKDICEECMTDDQWGYPGYRGDMDDDIHPAYNEVMSQSGAHCPECASAIVQEYEDEEKERMKMPIISRHVKNIPDPKRNFNPDWQDLNRSKDSFESAWDIAKEADWDTSFKTNATWSQEDIDRLNARNDKAREALRNRTPLPTRSNENALDRALSRARRENAKPKPKLRITRPEDWE